MYVSVTLAFTKKNWMSFRTQAPELLQQTAAENAERQVDLEEVGAFIFFISFDWNGEIPLHGMACLYW